MNRILGKVGLIGGGGGGKGRKFGHPNDLWIGSYIFYIGTYISCFFLTSHFWKGRMLRANNFQDLEN